MHYKRQLSFLFQEDEGFDKEGLSWQERILTFMCTKSYFTFHQHHWGHIFHYTNQEVSLLLTKDLNCIQRNWAVWTIWIQLVFNCITTNAKSKRACVPATIFCQFTVTYLSRSSRVCSWYSPRAWSSSWQRFPTVHSEAKKSCWAPPWQPTNEAQLGAK